MSRPGTSRPGMSKDQALAELQADIQRAHDIASVFAERFRAPDTGDFPRVQARPSALAYHLAYSLAFHWRKGTPEEIMAQARELAGATLPEEG